MRKSALTLLLLLFVVLAVPFSAWAQEFPKLEFFGGYSYVRMLSENWGGWNASVTKNLNEHLGITADIGSFGTSMNQNLTSYVFGADGHEYTFMIGPQLTLRGPQKISPFVHLLFGASHDYSNNSYVYPSGNVPSFFQSYSSNQFAMGFGGGVDHKLIGPLRVRGQIDYMGIRYGASSTTMSSWSKFWRLTAGVVLAVGRRTH
jgi:hypothetical protein